MNLKPLRARAAAPHPIPRVMRRRVSRHDLYPILFLFLVPLRPPVLPAQTVAIWFEDNVTKVFSHSPPRQRTVVWSRTSGTIRLLAARNEYEAFQMILRSDKPAAVHSITLSDLLSPEGRISSEHFSIYQVAYVPAGEHGLQPDPLLPLRGKVTLEPGRNQPFWLRLFVPESAAPGRYRGEIRVTLDDSEERIPLELEVNSFTLPHKQSLLRISPHWSRTSFVKKYYGEALSPKTEAYRQLVRKFYRELARAGIAPAHGFDLKRPHEYLTQKSPPPKLAFEKLDPILHWLLEELGLPMIDLDLYYSPFGRPPYPITDEYRGGTIAYLRLFAKHYKPLDWFDRLWIQNYGDEPSQTSQETGHRHPSYQAIRDYSALYKAAVPDLNVLLAEQPTPQLFGYVDIWNAPWHLVQRQDVLERRTFGERVIWYSLDTKVREPLLQERVNLWSTFAESLDGAWSWHLYDIGSLNKDDSSRRYHLFYDGKPLGIVDEPIISMRLEAMGEGKEDFEYLKGIESRFGADLAMDFARSVAIRPGPPGRSPVDIQELYALRKMTSILLESDQPIHVNQLTEESLESIEGVQIDTLNGGSVRLADAEPPARLHDFESLQGCRTRGPADAVISTEQATQGRGSAKIVFRRPPGSPPRELAFTISSLPVTDWSHYDFMEFDVMAAGKFSLFDLSVTLNDDLGRGYQFPGGVDWKKGDQAHSVGIFSTNGTFPYRWRRIVVDFQRYAGRFSSAKNRRRIREVHLRMGKGAINEPLPSETYTVYLDNLRLRKRRFRKQGELTSRPITAPRAGFTRMSWLGEWPPEVPGTVRFYLRRRLGEKWSAWQEVSWANRWGGVIDIRGKQDFQFKVTLRSDGERTPVLRAVLFYSE